MEIKSQAVMNTLEFFMKSVALSLREMHGFGEKRCYDVITDAVNRVEEYTDKYGSEYVSTAMDVRLKDYGISLEFKEKSKWIK